jgi:hypothetical protein
LKGLALQKCMCATVSDSINKTKNNFFKHRKTSENKVTDNDLYKHRRC